MPNIPSGFSLVTHVMSCPAPGGDKPMTITYGVANSPVPLLAQELHEIFAAEIWTVLGHDSTTLTETIMRDETFAANYADTVSGGNTNEPLPPNVALLVRKNTGMIGRKFRGRMYLPFCTYENDIREDGTMDGADQASYQAHFDDWLTAIDDSGSNGMVLLHSDATAPTVVASLIVEATIATQRRRLR